MTKSIKEKEKQLQFQLKAIEILDFSLSSTDKPVIDCKLFHFNISIEHRVTPENKLVFVIVSTDVLHDDKVTLLGSLKVSCIFEVTNMLDFFNKTKKIVFFPDQIIMMFNSISLSTFRGVMFSQFKGTFLHNAILPIVDPSSFKNMPVPK